MTPTASVKVSGWFTPKNLNTLNLHPLLNARGILQFRNIPLAFDILYAKYPLGGLVGDLLCLLRSQL